MATIQYPPNDIPSTPATNYITSPWTAPDESKWLYNPKGSWYPYREPSMYISAITTLTGVGPDALTSIASATLPIGQVIGIVVDDTLSFYQLRAGTSATELPGIIRPNDYNDITNTRFWKQIL
jgi:hypothetical protein